MSAEAAWAAMRRLVLDHDRRRDVAAALGLPFSRVRALGRLADGPAVVGALAEALGTDKPHASVIVADLEARGLATRAPHPRDGRAKVVTLTAEGRRAASHAATLLGTPPPALRALDDRDLATLAELLARVERQAAA